MKTWKELKDKSERRNLNQAVIYLESKRLTPEAVEFICCRIDNSKLPVLPSKIAEYVDCLIDDMRWDGELCY